MGGSRGSGGERRGGTRKAVDKLLAERREMFVLYNRVAGFEAYSGGKPKADRLQEFCQVLVDYIAAGHFWLYQRISEGRERRRAVLDAAGEAYPRIAATTDAAVEFNDRYGDAGEALSEEALAADLSRLGEQLAVRIELEDRLIDALLQGD